MAHVRDSDTSLWLHNKLGSSSDLWLGGSICSQLNQDVLRNIRECFIELQPQVKLKLLLSFLHIPRRNVEEWKIELEEILEVALVDSDQWVSMLAELLKMYPSTGLLNFQIEENASVFTDVVNELRKSVRKNCDQGLLPLECLYLNRNALTAVVGQLPPSAKHFTLKQKPKSATLRAELSQKSNDVTNLRKSVTTPSVPIRCRGLIKPLGEGAPLKGIPSRMAPVGFKSRTSPLGRLNTSPSNRVVSRAPPSGRKDGGIKLLEIDEQPMGYGRDAKRRKKVTEEVVESRKEKEGLPVVVSQPSTTPDYAVGLLSTSQLSGSTIPVIASAGTPNYAPSGTPGGSIPTAAEANLPVSVPTLPAAAAKTRDQQPMAVPEAHHNEIPVAHPNEDLPTSTVIHATTIGTLASLGGNTLQMTQQRVAFQTPQTVVQQLQQQQQQQPQQQQPMSMPTAPVQQVQTHVHSSVLMQPQPVLQQRKLHLTKEQMHEAQVMFTNSNKVTRPEKALILGFIAGSRDNPCPHLGQIVTIMLSENEEEVQKADGTFQTMVVETHFQMNYSSGEWKRVKKYRDIGS